MSNLGKRIQELRKEHNWSQTELANKVGVSKSQINRYENKQVSPPADILNTMAELFNTSVDFLINGHTGQKAQATLKNNLLLNQFKDIQLLPDDEQKTVIKFIGAYLRDFKAKQAYS